MVIMYIYFQRNNKITIKKQYCSLKEIKSVYKLKKNNNFVQLPSIVLSFTFPSHGDTKIVFRKMDRSNSILSAKICS